ncbi:MAG TPA: hypothetical protein VK958_13700 [Methylophilus sp.]|uniref:hypothetical protein n=1 Tax=Methylophilus sp. TaxID=29541 RepID=UPI002B8D372E|nr:hypothetical protein [Methylophilus sp.]HSH88288.1 hypothetical protein [Methylophilus sp.]
MSQSSRVNSATSAISLAAITAGAVAAAVVIMSIGSIVTIISIGSSINSGMQTASNIIDSDVEAQNVAVLPIEMHTMNVSHFHKAKKHFSKKEKSFYLDAILREDTQSIKPANDEQQKEQPKLSIKGNHVFASLNTDEFEAHLAAA